MNYITGYLYSSQEIQHNQFISVSWEIESSSGINNSLEITSSGIYLVNCSVIFDAAINNTAGKRVLRLAVNDQQKSRREFYQEGNHNVYMSLTKHLSLVNGDVVNLEVYQSSGQILPVLGDENGFRSYFSIVQA